MKPAPRLATLLSVAVVGSGVAVIGAATTWYRTIQPDRAITSAIGVVRVPGAVHSYSPSDFGSSLLPIGVLCLVCGLLAFLVGPRARAVLIGLVIVGALALIPLMFTVKKPVEAGARVESAPGRIVTPIGAVVAVAAAGAAFPISTKVRRVRMPETGPSDE
ncbi:MAG TPA: hypothetical protein VKV69_08735 [Actinomycetota bacterium]|nr:hypothetical protein [Actinomycetota bacterium]